MPKLSATELSTIRKKLQICISEPVPNAPASAAVAAPANGNASSSTKNRNDICVIS